MLLDKGTKEAMTEARDILESLATEDYPLEDYDNPEGQDIEQLPMGKNEGVGKDPEVDNRVLVYSLLGLLKKAQGKSQSDQIEGIKLQDRAKEISHSIPGGAAMFERKKWLLIPKLTSKDMFRDEHDLSDEELD